MAISSSEAIETLAAEIGENVYMDIAKWHLYLSDAHLHTVLAEKLFPMISNGRAVEEDQVLSVLNGIPVKLGGGKREVPLTDLLPMQCQVNLMDTLEEFQRKL
ncbi:MAG: DUF3181 family protein [Myxacorys californica WJT36-NPBG1]|jgi:hypothetical protein|nr:DUF3181 family protein [Myxacorys californica WJT36-NPBG1]